MRNIIVCGHSDCGGCLACLDAENTEKTFPHTHLWMRLLEPARDRMQENFGVGSEPERRRTLERANVVEQLHNLMTYPFVKEKVEKGELTLAGWHYYIGSGKIQIYDEDDDMFWPAN